MFSEGMQGGPAEVCSSGVRIDENCESSVPGLFAAGDCADQTRCVHLSAAGGSHAGHFAARWALKADRLDPEYEEVGQARQNALAPLSEGASVRREEIEDLIASIMWEHVGPVRTEDSLMLAQAMLEDLTKQVEHIGADNLHELMRAHEVKTMWQVARFTTAASLRRKETRFGPYFKRKDYPETSDEYCGQMVLRRNEEKISVRFEPLTYEVSN
jgi:adenylylsulfate reductase subunit A